MCWKSGGCQYLEQPNVERPIFLNFEVSNIKITKDELFNFLIFALFFSLFNLLKLIKKTQSIW